MAKYDGRGRKPTYPTADRPFSFRLNESASPEQAAVIALIDGKLDALKETNPAASQRDAMIALLLPLTGVQVAEKKPVAVDLDAMRDLLDERIQYWLSQTRTLTDATMIANQEVESALTEEEQQWLQSSQEGQID